ncbi:hypothetical protein [Streptomyces acidicola]|uniref:hypothetical protein n=1 Tax=Streptomyces acidicola TaxID=2596892 RepID=UPI00381175B5
MHRTLASAGIATADPDDGVLNGLLSNSQLAVPATALSCGGGLIPVLNGASCQGSFG